MLVDNRFYLRYSGEERAKIGKYASIHGAAAAARYFSKTFGNIRESTVKSIKADYLQEMRRKRSNGDFEDVKLLPKKKQGRRVLLGEALDKKLQLYLKEIRKNGGPLTASVAIGAARGLLLAENRSRLAEFGGHIDLNRHWAYSLYNRMGFVQRKSTTAKGKYSAETFIAEKRKFLNEVVLTVEQEEIPPELIINWDQTGIRFVSSSSWTMEEKGVKRVEVVGQSDKRQITAVLAGTIQGDLLPLQLIYKGKTLRCHPNYKFPPGWHITHSPNHWSNETTMIEYIENIVIPYVENIREMLYTPSTPGLIIMDNFKGQITKKIDLLLEENHLHTCLLPANTTDILQPMDLSVNKPAKSFIKDLFCKWYSEQLLQQFQAQDDVPLQDVVLEPIDLSLPVLRNISAEWFVKMADYISSNPQFIVNGFVRAGICRALDGVTSDEELDDILEEMPVDSDYTDSELSDEDQCVASTHIQPMYNSLVRYSSTEEE